MTKLPLAVPPVLPPRVLVVEDTAEIRLLIALILRKTGIEVEQASNGQEAMALIETAAQSGHPFHLAVMDIQMPVMDGLETTRRLRAAQFTLPIIALTAQIAPKDQDYCFQNGFSAYLSKPVTKERLRACVMSFLSP